MKKPQITFAFVLAHSWVLMIFFGALVFDTLIVYPNTFHDVPRSLERAMAFATVRGPGDFFPPLGFVSTTTFPSCAGPASPRRPSSARFPTPDLLFHRTGSILRTVCVPVHHFPVPPLLACAAHRQSTAKPVAEASARR